MEQRKAIYKHFRPKSAMRVRRYLEKELSHFGEKTTKKTQILALSASICAGIGYIFSGCLLFGQDKTLLCFEYKALGLEIGQYAREGRTLNAQGLGGKLHTGHHAALTYEVEHAGAQTFEGKGTKFSAEKGAAVGDVLHETLHGHWMSEQEGKKGFLVDDPNLAIGHGKYAHGKTALRSKEKGGGQNDGAFEEVDGEVFVFLLHLGARGAASEDVYGATGIALTDNARIFVEMLAAMGHCRQPFGKLCFGAIGKKGKLVEHKRIGGGRV